MLFLQGFINRNVQLELYKESKGIMGGLYGGLSWGLFCELGFRVENYSVIPVTETLCSLPPTPWARVNDQAGADTGCGEVGIYRGDENLAWP